MVTNRSGGVLAPRAGRRSTWGRGSTGCGRSTFVPVKCNALSVSCSNGKEGANEVIRVIFDETLISVFQNRDSGDSVEGWNEFVTDPAGTTTLGRGRHTLRLEVSGGDGCVEIDVATLSPGSTDTSG